MKYEFAGALGPVGQVDRNAGVIRGVSVISQGPALGHGVQVDGITLSQMMTAAKQYSGGLKVVDRHVTGGDSIFSTVGTLKNFRIEGIQLKADLYLLKSQQTSEKLFEMAETMPDTFGLSVAFSGETEIVDGQARARCAEIYNAALVDTPAANPTGLFSAKPLDAAGKGKAMPNDEEFSAFTKQFADATAASEARFAKLEKAVGDITECMKGNKDFAALQAKVTELSAATESLKTLVSDRTEMAKSIAREFAANTGTKPAAGQNPVDPAAPAAPVEKKGAEKYVELAKKHFAAGKVSETEAFKLAMNEDPESYKAFRTSGLRVKLKA